MTVYIEKPAINLREKLAELDKPTGIAGEAMLRAETPQEQFNLIGAGRRNLLINGDFQVSQRGDYSSATASSHNAYTVDRWQTTSVGVSSTVQHQSVTLPNGWETKSAKVAATSSAGSGAYIGLSQPIEDGQRILRSGGTWTVSAWVKTNRNDVVFRLGAVKNMGEPVVGDGEWHYHTATFSYDTSGSSTQGIFLITYDNASTAITTGDYIEMAQFQLEVGKVATPFEHRSYGEELALCQRYFERQSYVSGSVISTGHATNASTAIAVLNYTEKRATPSIDLPSASKTDGISFLTASSSYPTTLGTNTAGNINKHSCRINGSGYSSVTSQSPSALYVTGAHVIDINAEL